MKKLSFLILPVLVMCMLLPQNSHAMKVKKFKHYYLGTWENTQDSCGTTGQTGSIEIKISKIKKSGKITKATVWFNDGRYGDMPAKGRIYKENGVKKIRLKYNEHGWNYDTYVINGTITPTEINGEYSHSYNGCNWSGTVDLTKEYN